ncbi:MAG TPA: ABC transporter ATP-binding protein [Desulfobulbaceae bacterium]|nr:ABC transporter ATP-binding protein [Desulfobulbaceae bacterium]
MTIPKNGCQVMNIIEVENLQKKFHGKEVLRDLSLTVGRGDIYGFLGPNGSGKTTTLRIMLGLLAKDGGRIMVMGQNVELQDPEIRKKVNMLPESHGFYSWMRSTEYLVYFGELYGRKLDKSMRQYLLELVGLDSEDTRSIRQYSRGMKQRLGIARTLINDPELVFLDEPTNGLDPKGRRDIHDLLKRLNKERSMTIVLSTHILDDVEHLCNRIGILSKGKMQYQGSLNEAEGVHAPLYRFYFEREVERKNLAAIPGVHVLSQDKGWVHCRLDKNSPDKAVAALVSRGLPISQVVRENQELEEIYLHYTGGAS